MNHTLRLVEEGFKHLFLIVVALISLIPIIWMLATSFKAPEEVFSGHLFWANQFNVNGYLRVLREIPIGLWAWNSAVTASLQTLGQLIVGVAAAFAFARYRFPGRDALFFFVLITMMIPHQVTMVPTYMIVNELEWLNSFAGVIVPHLASGYAIFLLRQSFMTVPYELGEAAVIDGCTPLGMMWHVYLRLSVTVISALAVILFVGNWNEYNWPLLVLTDKMMQTLPIAFVQFREEEALEWVPTMAVATLSMLPILFLYLAAQKNFIQGFMNSGLKG
ncbi:MAG: carbohydrate ABC transporter permease [Paenibacillus macerans]|uniref:Binding--dependent transport system inner membrane component family protein n=2 Tax=Paenibacillus TaxID=44249 RepID=A0A091A2F9_PAEMA|nr:MULTISPECIES: carbohydrate ABC transporter permease [Paenibacillus]KFN10486.1 binding--dependent transport system inner membrane component family protein [Paenibacillus macerans]MBS5914930.1 carbohydrate ABC transporter permease [Paenibacillus macerans]MCY7561951.1 carbohydrate ABC transporter permease [Paenibacillus macerans]MDU7473445.1 carbohydrate ABC transporter permease [Paenibacillus macerans]MEC0136751.1 carbohydrate ABC transporter permease [Paenibacillus macerans]